MDDSQALYRRPPRGKVGRYFLLAARLILGVVFVYAAYTKLKQPWLVFAMSIDSYRLLPEWAVLGIARVLPWVELLLGLLLLAGFGLRWVAGFSSAILLVFFVLMIRTYGKGMGIDCGCFGAGEALSAKTLVRDGVLLALSIALTVAAWRRAGKERYGFHVTHS